MNRLIAVALLAVASLASAQDSETKKLEFLLGEWESKETVHPPQGQKIEFTLKGTANWAMENRAIVVDESFEAMGQKVANHIVVRYNPASKKYRMWWYSNTAQEPIVFSGAFEGDKKLVFVSLPQAEGFARQPHRITYNLIEAGAFDATLEVQYDDKWSLLTEAKYRRTKPL